MDEESTTAMDDQETDPAATDQQTLDEDNLDTSESTDTSAGDETTADEDDNPATAFDADIDEWASKTGRKIPESDSERELLQEIRNGQREFSRSRQAKQATQELDKALQEAKPTDDKQEDEDEGYDDELAREVAELKADRESERTTRLRSEFFIDQSVTDDEAKMMGEILKEKAERGGKNAYDYWTNPNQLSDWHELAKARLANATDHGAIKEVAARNERERIAKEQRASGVRRNASKTVTQEKSGYNRAEFLRSDD